MVDGVLPAGFPQPASNFLDEIRSRWADLWLMIGLSNDSAAVSCPIASD